MNAANLDGLGPYGRIRTFADPLLKGFGQIMLQENAAAGALFVAGIFYGSITMGLGAILAVCCGTLTAKLLGFGRTEIDKGLYGFSPALVGVALLLCFKPVFVVWLLVAAGSAAAAMMQHFFIRRSIPAFTLPFVVVTWAILLFGHLIYPEILAVSGGATANLDVWFPLRGYGQVIFQSGVVAGGIFLIAVLISSPAAAVYGIIGAVVAGLASYLAGAPAEAAGMGLFSYNAVLCAITFAGKRIEDAAWAILAVAISVILALLMARFQLVQLTFPFVAASCIVTGIKSSRTRLPSRFGSSSSVN